MSVPALAQMGNLTGKRRYYGSFLSTGLLPGWGRPGLSWPDRPRTSRSSANGTGERRGDGNRPCRRGPAEAVERGCSDGPQPLIIPRARTRSMSGRCRPETRH
jgi:hypothetical protein